MREALRLCLEEVMVPEMHESVCVAAHSVGEPDLDSLLPSLLRLAHGEELSPRPSTSDTQRTERDRVRLAAIRALSSFPSAVEQVTPALLGIMGESGKPFDIEARPDARSFQRALRDVAKDALVALLKNGPEALQDDFGRALASVYVKLGVNDRDPASYLPPEVLDLPYLYRTPEFRQGAVLSAANQWENAPRAIAHLDPKGVTALLVVWGALRPHDLETLLDALVLRGERVLSRDVIAALLRAPGAQVRLTAIRYLDRLREMEQPEDRSLEIAGRGAPLSPRR